MIFFSRWERERLCHVLDGVWAVVGEECRDRGVGVCGWGFLKMQ